MPTSRDGSGGLRYWLSPDEIVPFQRPRDVEERARLGRVRRLGDAHVARASACSRRPSCSGRASSRRSVELPYALEPAMPIAKQHDRGMHDVAAVAAPVARDEREQRPGRHACRARPRATIVARTNAENVYAIRPGFELAGAERRAGCAPATSAPRRGRQRAPARARGTLVRRHAISGPIPISSSSGSPNVRRKKS